MRATVTTTTADVFTITGIYHIFSQLVEVNLRAHVRPVQRQARDDVVVVPAAEVFVPHGCAVVALGVEVRGSGRLKHPAWITTEKEVVLADVFGACTNTQAEVNS